MQFQNDFSNVFFVGCVCVFDFAKMGYQGCLSCRPGYRRLPAFSALFFLFPLFYGGSEQHLRNPENLKNPICGNLTSSSYRVFFGPFQPKMPICIICLQLTLLSVWRVFFEIDSYSLLAFFWDSDFLDILHLFGDNFGVPLGGNQAPPSFWKSLDLASA